MSTFLHSYIDDIENKWSEIDLLSNKAKEVRDSDVDLYNALCRSISILIVSQLEGFTKNVLKAFINDLNRNLQFHELPKAIKRTYCSKYIPKLDSTQERQYNKRIERLILKFDEVQCEISFEPFFLSKNKNPSPYLIKTIFENIGVKDVFLLLNKSKFETIFSNSDSELLEIIESERNLIKNQFNSFPYKENHIDYKFSKSNSTKTLWEEFLEQINQRRHDVAHGNVNHNISSIEELEQDKLKSQIIEIAFIKLISESIK